MGCQGRCRASGGRVPFERLFDLVRGVGAQDTDRLVLEPVVERALLFPLRPQALDARADDVERIGGVDQVVSPGAQRRREGGQLRLRVRRQGQQHPVLLLLPVEVEPPGHVDAALPHQKDVEASDQGQEVLRPAAHLLGEEPVGVEELEAVGRQGVEPLIMIEVITAPQDFF